MNCPHMIEAIALYCTCCGEFVDWAGSSTDGDVRTVVHCDRDGNSSEYTEVRDG